MSGAATGSELRDLALRLLAARDHSCVELRRKLGARGYATVEIAPVLADLVAQGLQSDRRYAEGYIAQRTGRGYGPLRIRAELRARGVSPDIIATTLDESAWLWTDRLHELVQSRFGTLDERDQRELAKRARFLERRGFAADAIRNYLFD